MILHVDLDTASVALLEPATFTGLHVAVAPAVGDPDWTRLAAALVPLGRVEDDHVWLDRDELASLASPHRDDAWDEGFAAMVGYAADHGYLADDGALRAHVEWD